jgi:protein-export membrane protein SecD
MEKAWYWKIIFVLVLVVGSVLYLLPTFLPDALPKWYTDFFEKKINLGLDLQGGIHLVLGVEVDKALEDKADQYVGDFKDALKEKRISFRKVFRVPGVWDIQFELDDPADEKKLRKRILAGYNNLKVVEPEDPVPGVVRVTFREEYVKELRKNARDQSRVTVRNRVDELGVAMPTIAPHGEEGILVQLPGMFDPERAKKLLGRTAQLEFKIVDDKGDFLKKLKADLPEGIKIDYYSYSGPNDEPVTEAFLIARGKGTQGKNRLMDFFNNVAEIEAFLDEKKVDKKVSEQIVTLARKGITPKERKEILDLARPYLAAAGNPQPVKEDEQVKKEAEENQAEEKPEKQAKENVESKKEEEVEKKEAATPPAVPKTEPKAKEAQARSRSADFAELERLLRGKVPDGREIGFKRTEAQLEIEYRTYYLYSEVALTGDYITDASVRPDSETGQPEVSLNFDRTGAKMFEKLTGAHVRERMAIVLEGEVSSAPVIQARIGGGSARITLGATRNYNEALAEAQDLAVVLRAGAMPAPVRILQERTVGPTMGEDARRQGTYALGIGLILVILFMLIYYRVSGAVADLALILNAVFILAVLAAFQATLTLPGIAGIILTIGMAVDANVIINERVREELHSGKTPRAAVDAGYSRAFWTIFDANFTTLIAAVVLWSYGSGPIQGFAVTLFIGILASMFTAIFVTRLVMDYLTIRLKVEKLSV